MRSGNMIADKRLLASGIASQAQFDQASHGLDLRVSRSRTSEQQIGVALANLGGDPRHRSGAASAGRAGSGRLDRARLDLSYTVITAPDRWRRHQGGAAAGGRLHCGLGARIRLGVDATMCGSRRISRRCSSRICARGSTATHRNRSLSGAGNSPHGNEREPGTGSQFSMLPPENATGNWVKVVQRVPVRLQIDRSRGRVSVAEPA